MKTEENKRMLALSRIVADLKAENMELVERVQQLADEYNDVVRQLNGKEEHKDEDPAKLLLDNMQKMRDHCDMLERENKELERFSKAMNAFVIATHYRTIALVVIELMDMLRKEKIRTDCTNEYVMYKLIQTLREKANTIKPNVYE